MQWLLFKIFHYLRQASSSITMRIPHLFCRGDAARWNWEVLEVLLPYIYSDLSEPWKWVPCEMILRLYEFSITRRVTRSLKSIRAFLYMSFLIRFIFSSSSLFLFTRTWLKSDTLFMLPISRLALRFFVLLYYKLPFKFCCSNNKFKFCCC